MGLFGKTIVVEKGPNWEQMLVDMNANVNTFGVQIGKLESTHKEHVEKQNKDLDKLKDHICKKITEIKCPKDSEINELVKEKKEQNGEIEKLGDKFRETKDSVDKFLEQIQGEKRAWRKIIVRASYGLGGISTITGIITKIIGIW